MDRQHKTYFAWLNNAYGMEISAERAYRMHAKDASRGMNDFPELVKGLMKQSEIAKHQGERVKSCLDRHGITPHPLKSALGEGMGILIGFTGDVTIDKVIMNNLTDYGGIHFEIAGYRTLVAASQLMNDPETEKICREILKEEEEFATWLETQLEPVGAEFLRRTV